MTRNSHSTNTGSTVAWVIGVLFVLYVLSPGPVVRVIYGAGGKIGFTHLGPLEQFLEAVYAPIAFAANTVPGVSEFYVWYFAIWGIS